MTTSGFMRPCSPSWFGGEAAPKFNQPKKLGSPFLRPTLNGDKNAESDVAEPPVLLEIPLGYSGLFSDDSHAWVMRRLPVESSTCSYELMAKSRPRKKTGGSLRFGVHYACRSGSRGHLEWIAHADPT